MGLREFITNRLFRNQLHNEDDEFVDIRPPQKPTREYIDQLIEKLFDEDSCLRADRELELIGRPAIPALVAVLNEPRFHAKYERLSSYVPQPLPLVLGLLAKLSPHHITANAETLIRSPSSEVRKSVASHFGESGLEDITPFLETLLNDEDGFVRSYVSIGVKRAIREGKAGKAFRQRMYDLFLDQCDQEWKGDVNDAARIVVMLNPERAAIDFADERWWTPTNECAYKILDVCNGAGIKLPPGPVRALLDHSLPKAVGRECYPHEYVVAYALVALARSLGNESKPLLESALGSDQDQIQESASRGLALLAGLENPIAHVFERFETVGYQKLTNPQKFVYCSVIFDSEVCNGGLMQFFGNTSGDHAVDTLKALRVIGPPEAHHALDAAMKLVGPLSRESDRDLRLTAFEDRYDELMAGFKPLDTEFYLAYGPHRQRRLLYAIENKEHFR